MPDEKQAPKATKRSQMPIAPQPPTLPKLPDGQAWDKVKIGPMLFAYRAATTIAGALAYCKGNEALVVDRFNRGERINVPAKLDGRRIVAAALKEKDEAKRNAALLQLQQAVIDFDTTTVRARVIAPPEVALPKGQKTFTMDQMKEFLAAQGFTTKEV